MVLTLVFRDKSDRRVFWTQDRAGWRCVVFFFCCFIMSRDVPWGGAVSVRETRERLRGLENVTRTYIPKAVSSSCHFRVNYSFK